jgi:hypothetical protein
LTVEVKPPMGPDEAANQLLSRFPSDDEFWRELRRDFDFRISFGIHMNGWNRGFDFTTETFKRLAATGATVGFDLYLYGDDD